MTERRYYPEEMTERRYYPVVGARPTQEPDYARVARALSDEELADELARGRGDRGFRAAVRAEADRRKERS